MPRTSIQQFRAALADGADQSPLTRAYRQIARTPASGAALAGGEWVTWPPALAAAGISAGWMEWQGDPAAAPRLAGWGDWSTPPAPAAA